MGNSQNNKMSQQDILETLPQNAVEKAKMLKCFDVEEIQLLVQLFENLVLRSKSQQGMDRDVFVKYCPIPGLWGHRIYRQIKNFNNSTEDYINLQDFLCGLRYLCRSDDDELDSKIFEMFDLCENKVITKDDIVQMLINFPDMGFSSSQNINAPDKFYQNIKDQVKECISKCQKD